MKTEPRTTHTPGPWELSGDCAEIFPKTGPNSSIELCRVVGPWDGSSYYDEETAKSNARLIAVAPELLAALKDVHDSPCAQERCLRRGDTGVPACPACAAIAKAEGKP
jgi:hypothetical protein